MAEENKEQEQCTIQNVVCSSCGKDIKPEDDKHCFTLSSDLVLYNLISTKRAKNDVPLILKVDHIQIHAQPMKNRAC